ncbi:MAG TPA: VirB10/TraB/TrbI family type IV secretion system protein [Arsenophonus apicola]
MNEEDIASLEREAREKRQQALKSELQNKSPDPIQPTINQLKKRKKGYTTFILAFIGVGLIFLAWGSQWLYRNFLWHPAEEKKHIEMKENNNDWRKRTDLGKYNENEIDASQTLSSVNTPPLVETNKELVFPPQGELNKALFLTRADRAETSKNQIKTRKEEMNSLFSRNALSKMDNAASPLEEKEKNALAVKPVPYNPDLYVAENTAIPCSLDYRFVSDKAGKIRCTIVRDIWSASGNTKLIEKGTTAFGLYQSGELKQGEGRAFIMITKLRTRQPPYLDIPLVDTAAAGELGGSGVDGWIDNHYWRRFSGALMIGMIPDIGAWAANNAGKKDRNVDYTENSRQALAEMAQTTLENSINIPPTLYKNQGEIILLITGKDIDFSHIYTLRRKNG